MSRDDLLDAYNAGATLRSLATAVAVTPRSIDKRLRRHPRYVPRTCSRARQTPLALAEELAEDLLTGELSSPAGVDDVAAWFGVSRDAAYRAMVSLKRRGLVVASYRHPRAQRFLRVELAARDGGGG